MLADPYTALKVEEENLVGARRVEISGWDFRFQHGEGTEGESQHRGRVSCMSSTGSQLQHSGWRRRQGRNVIIPDLCDPKETLRTRGNRVCRKEMDPDQVTMWNKIHQLPIAKQEPLLGSASR